jgi:L-iditol 2-dehydrogenase
VQGRCSLLLQSDNSSMAPSYPTAYAPELVLKSPEFKILEEGVVPQRNPNQNIAAAYAPGAQLHLIEKPIPKAREGEVVLHVRATGICGRCVWSRIPRCER